jgi:hypothetical protein
MMTTGVCATVARASGTGSGTYVTAARTTGVVIVGSAFGAGAIGAFMAGDVAGGSGSGTRVKSASTTGTHTIDRLVGMGSIGTSTTGARAIVVRTATTASVQIVARKIHLRLTLRHEIWSPEESNMASSHVNHLKERSQIPHPL